jgi:hypothetical protein
MGTCGIAEFAPEVNGNALVKASPNCWRTKLEGMGAV